MTTLLGPVSRRRPFPHPARARNLKLAAAAVVVLSVVGAEVGLLGHTFDGAGKALRHIDLRWVILAIAAELASVGAAALVQRVMLASGGVRLRRRRVYRLALESNALNVSMPLGNGVSSAYSFSRLRRWGVLAPVAGFTVAIAGLMSFVAFLALSVSVAVSQDNSMWALAGSVSAAFVVVALVVTALLVHRSRPTYLPTALRGGWSRATTLVHRDPAAGLAGIDRFFRDLSNVAPRGRDWARGVLFSAGYWLADLFCLIACQRALGVGHLGLLALSGAYLAGMGVAGLSLLPGGLGTVETTMILVLGHSGVGRVVAAAMVLVYRLISVVLVGGIGWLGWTLTRRAATAELKTPVTALR